LGNCTGVSFIDSTSLDVCLNQRIASHKVFAELASRGKTSTDWFFGFKLYLVINDWGELLNVLLTLVTSMALSLFQDWSASCSERFSATWVTSLNRFMSCCVKPSVSS
jgi:hypothetical protein